MWRQWTSRGSRVYLATATDWRNASSYVQHTEHELFPDLGPAGTEDMFLYMDPRGRMHAVFHHMYGANTTTAWWLLAAGGHAYSPDGGLTWVYTGIAWGNSTSLGYTAKFTDGSTYHYTRLERPVLIAGADGEPAFLVNAAQYGTGQSAKNADGGDAAYTLIQPIAQHA
jgi:hypothetical protein